ncbi:MAG: DUF3953 domain-containing protein [Eubacterium sp.]|nr:DUF3953 domain-containing protein [Eubacterium sp.]MBR4241598.1 DUF3953 domain-containing protein [Eubacterium sp.]MBR7060395.1 DUF3953 domain-containing protein [Eubacterium sp.]
MYHRVFSGRKKQQNPLGFLLFLAFIFCLLLLI